MRTTIVAWINADRFQIRFRDLLYERTGEMTVHNWGFCNSTSSRTKLSIHKSIYRPSRSLLSDFLIFASRVANALRKLRYHQLCSPASLPTEWTQSGSLSSESSLRWYICTHLSLSLSLLYMHSLTDRIMGYNRHATSRSISSSWISTHLNVQHCIVSAKRATWCLPLSIELDILPRYTICFITSREISTLILIRQKEWENAPVTWVKRKTLLIFPRSYQ